MAALSISLSSSLQSKMDQPTLELCVALSELTSGSQLAVEATFQPTGPQSYDHLPGVV
jgi:hypothetical protein